MVLKMNKNDKVLEPEIIENNSNRWFSIIDSFTKPSYQKIPVKFKTYDDANIIDAEIVNKEEGT